VRGALLNLVDNAVKATGPGDTIRLTAACEVPDPGWLTISVEDSGPGIPEAERESALDRFTTPRPRPPGRTGLGLAIAGAVCRAHGGRLAIGGSALGGALVTLELSVGCDAERGACASS